MVTQNTGTQRASAALSSGKAVKVLRGDLALIKTPEATKSFTPVPHNFLVDGIEAALNKRSLKISSENYAVQNEGQKLYGTMVLTNDTEEYSFALGIRTSNDKTLAAQMIAGMRVFVCDNGSFSGEPITWRKHTSHLDIMAEIESGVDLAVARFGRLNNRVAELKEMELSNDTAKAMVVDSVMAGVMSERLILDVVKEYLEPSFKEFEPRNQWSLHNAYTTVFRALRPNIAMDNAIELGKFFAL
jgi:uncharacterized protein DUF932